MTCGYVKNSRGTNRASVSELWFLSCVDSQQMLMDTELGWVAVNRSCAFGSTRTKYNRS
jgi:hypothetical protein